MPDSVTDAWGKLDVIRRWYVAQLAYLLAALDAIPEGNGTMLDNTVVLRFSEITRGNTHSHMNDPFVVAGSGGGYFKTGQFISYPDAPEKPHSSLLVSVLNAMGLEDTTFGDPNYATGDIPELKA